VRPFESGLVGVEAREDAQRWVQALEAKGGTDIHRAMLEALSQVEGERPAIVIFLTDGLATEGVVETDQILAAVDEAAPDNVRIFTFGLGDEVNTVLLDRMARDHKGASAYVRPGQRIDEEVSAFYAKVSTPLLSDIELDFGGVTVLDTYPYPLPDLFAGTQIVLTGRYRGAGPTTVVLRGTVNGERQTFEYGDVRFRAQGGPAFVPRLWAMRKVGYLLNQIRLHGESEELVHEIVDLSVRYGIMTPYTSFLVQEDAEVFSEEGRRETAKREYVEMEEAPPAAPSGRMAVDQAQDQLALEDSERATGVTGQAVKVIGSKTFLLREGTWIDTTFDPDRMTPLEVGFLSDDYFALVGARPAWAEYLSVGERVLVVLDGQAYRVVAEGKGERIEVPTPLPTPTGQVARATPAPRTTPTVRPAVAPRAVERPGMCAGALGALALLLAAAWVLRR
jgi:Ca-activated chloride channel family protein